MLVEDFREREHLIDLELSRNNAVVVFHLLIDVIGKTLFESMNTFVQIIIRDAGSIITDSIDSLTDQFIQQVGYFIVINIVIVDKRCDKLLDGRSF